ncbi:zinc finger MYND domain-containing protein 10 [Planoprotostelium fungivorum]|uniref:Zinc finger MYND domain-containing protein 10 n=1 Tax=Planoprotostelium fungivorum TaxID=1890364 RepID=A0A2P6NPI0_9EUKA|nr:zinc finger MYND domain-containing protein 10 [Planoprotostelium fungivorum]
MRCDQSTLRQTGVLVILKHRCNVMSLVHSHVICRRSGRRIRDKGQTSSPNYTLIKRIDYQQGYSTPIMFGFGGGKMIGSIMANEAPPTKAKKYVELLLPEEEDEERVLMGEPATFTRFLHRFADGFSTWDLEIYAACCGLQKLMDQGKKAVDSSHLINAQKSPRSFDTVCHWVYETPIMPTSDDADYSEAKPQYTREYASVIVTPIQFIYLLITDASCASIIRHLGDTYAHLMERLRDLATRTDKMFQQIAKTSLDIATVLNTVPFDSSKVTNFDSQEEDDVADEMQRRWRFQDDVTSKRKEESWDGEKRCGYCHKAAESLKLCAKCKSIRYCGRECQVNHWPAHKRECIAK